MEYGKKREWLLVLGSSSQPTVIQTRRGNFYFSPDNPLEQCGALESIANI